MAKSFRLLCFCRLKRKLGEIDAFAECQEIAVREFLRICRNTEDPKITIQDLSKVHNIRVDSVDLQRFAGRNTELQLIAVTQTFEAFLNDYIVEHPRLGSREGRSEGETLVDLIVRKLKVAPSKSDALKKGLEYRVYNYYRSLRNFVAHATTPNPNKKALDELKRDCHECPKYARLGAPNSYNALSFDDYVLFTRASKELAEQLCEVGSLSKIELLNWARDHDRRRGSAERRANALRAILRIAFGICREEAESIVQLLLRENGPLA